VDPKETYMMAQSAEDIEELISSGEMEFYYQGAVVS